MTKIKFKEGNNWVDIGLEYYPIGAIYQSTSNTSPSSLFGGTWTEITDRFLLAAGTTYAAASTGGAATVTLDNTMIPSHTHSVGAHSHGLNSHTHSIGAHAHGLNSHTHTYAKVNSPTGSTTLTVDQIPSHTHGSPDSTDKIVTASNPNTKVSTSSSNNWGMLNWSLRDATSATGGGKGHTHTTSTTSTNTGGASGSTANSTAFDSGAATGSTANSTAFDSGATGGGGAHENMPPYLAVYTWQRVA